MQTFRATPSMWAQCSISNRAIECQMFWEPTFGVMLRKYTRRGILLSSSSSLSSSDTRRGVHDEFNRILCLLGRRIKHLHLAICSQSGFSFYFLFGSILSAFRLLAYLLCFLFYCKKSSRHLRVLHCSSQWRSIIQ